MNSNGRSIEFQSHVLTVSFSGFWPRFNPERFFIPLLIESLPEFEFRVVSEPANVNFFSVFEPGRRARLRSRKSNLLTRSKQKKLNNYPNISIWFTGENVRPPVDGYDLSLSFDLDDYGGSNVFFPLWLQSVDFFNCDLSFQQNPEIRVYETHRVSAPLNAFVAERNSLMSERPRFVCCFVNNLEPTRMRAISLLRKYGEVDVFGASQPSGVRHKVPTASEYKFMLCFENDFFPGYVTEKLPEAYALGCIPLWYGPDQPHLLNPDAYINAFRYPNLASFASCVAELDSDSEAANRLSSQPLISSESNALALIQSVKAAIRRCVIERI